MCAQWTAAVAARDSANWQPHFYSLEFGTAAVSGVSLFLSLFAAIQAFRAFRSTKRTEVAQTRAYLFVQTATLVDGSQVEGDREYVPGAGVEIKNFGITPANNVKVWVAFAFGPTDPNWEPPGPKMEDCLGGHVFPPNAGNTYLRPLTMDPHQQGMENTYSLLPVLTEQINKSQSGLYVYGRVTYTDVFQGKRETNFRYVFSGKWPPPKPDEVRFSICANGNESK